MAGSEKARSLREQYPTAIPLTGGRGETFKWDKVGKTLEGRFLKLRDGSMGGQLVNIDTGTDVVTAAAPATLAEALDGVKAGTRVAIRYMGEEPSKRKPGQSYKVFDVVAIPE